MSNTAKCFFYGVLTFSLSLTSAQAQQAEALSRGAVILAEKTEPVSFLGPDNQPLERAPQAPGMLFARRIGCSHGSRKRPAAAKQRISGQHQRKQHPKMKISSLSKNLSKTKDFRAGDPS